MITITILPISVSFACFFVITKRRSGNGKHARRPSILNILEDLVIEAILEDLKVVIILEDLQVIIT